LDGLEDLLGGVMWEGGGRMESVAEDVMLGLGSEAFVATIG